MKNVLLAAFLLLAASYSEAQQFIHSGTIEYQVVKNNHSMLGDEGIFAEQFKKQIPRLSTSYYTYTFNDNKAVYKFDRNDQKTATPWNREVEDEIWYNDYTTGAFSNYKFVMSDYYLLNGNLMDIEWKLSPNETRVIAGFNCRKATAIIFDSVYIFAFYTDEITVNGGPMGIHGLPGTILGLTIPRTYTSWVATKVEMAGVDSKKIQAPTKGKKKDATELIKQIQTMTKDWGQYAQQLIWQLGL